MANTIKVLWDNPSETFGGEAGFSAVHAKVRKSLDGASRKEIIAKLKSTDRGISTDEYRGARFAIKRYTQQLAVATADLTNALRERATRKAAYTPAAAADVKETRDLAVQKMPFLLSNDVRDCEVGSRRHCKPSRGYDSFYAYRPTDPKKLSTADLDLAIADASARLSYMLGEEATPGVLVTNAAKKSGELNALARELSHAYSDQSILPRWVPRSAQWSIDRAEDKRQYADGPVPWPG